MSRDTGEKELRDITLMDPTRKNKKRKHKGKSEGRDLTKGVGKRVKFDEPDQGTPESCDERPARSVSGSAVKADRVARPSIKKPLADTARHTRLQNKPATIGVPATMLRRRDELLAARKALPIWPQAQNIREALRESNILVLTGETGSGKSTQVPQLLLDEPWCTKPIAVTQPRRVAATSLARRVAEEMGSFFGKQSPAAKVGYSVRFDNATGPNTKIKFLTEGMLLQELLRDPDLSQYSAVIVDEVHERSVNVDLILGFLKNLVVILGDKEKRRPNLLKVVVMSATADVEGLVRFFNPDSDTSSDPGKGSISKTTTTVRTCFIEGRQYPVKTVYLPEPTSGLSESALKLIFRIHNKEPLPGDILVFLTGQDKIESLQKLINDCAAAMDKKLPKLLVLPLFAALPQEAQQLIFQQTPNWTRKVILATNIAETSVTVPGVRFVIDCGKAKVKQYRSNLGLESLLAKPISKSAAIQRKGRAGREAPGQCYRLYTEEGYNGLEDRTSPEILRCDLTQAILTMKARNMNDVLNFPFLDSPPRDALGAALINLVRLGAIEKTAAGNITEMGLKMSRLPVPPPLGRILIEAAKPERDCLLDVIDIVAVLSTEEGLFLNIGGEEQREEVEAARRDLYRREGDHLTFLTTVQRYAEENSDRKAWCDRHFVSHRAMRNIMNIRKQLRQQCQMLKLLTSPDPDQTSSTPNIESILVCLLQGFLYKTARLMPDKSYQTFSGKHKVSIHPSSFMFGRQTKAEAIVFSEFLYTNKAYASKVSAVETKWIEAALREVWGEYL